MNPETNARTDASDAVERRIPVRVSPDAVRLYADKALLVDLGRDFELVLLQIGPIVKEYFTRGKDDEETEGYVMDPSQIEVGRIRMSPFRVTEFIMRAMERLIAEDRLDTDRVMNQLSEFIADSKAAREAEEAA